MRNGRKAWPQKGWMQAVLVLEIMCTINFCAWKSHDSDRYPAVAQRNITLTSLSCKLQIWSPNPNPTSISTTLLSAIQPLNRQHESSRLWLTRFLQSLLTTTTLCACCKDDPWLVFEMASLTTYAIGDPLRHATLSFVFLGTSEFSSYISV